MTGALEDHREPNQLHAKSVCGRHGVSNALRVWLKRWTAIGS